MRHNDRRLGDTSVASVNSALQRAGRLVAEKVPSPTQQQTLRAIDDARVREMFPGDHLGFSEHPDAFAAQLHAVLSELSDHDRA